jgi:FkbM family methyltransferase
MLTAFSRFLWWLGVGRPKAPVALKHYPGLRIDVHAKFDRYISRDIARTGEWETFETELVHRFLRPGDVFVDIGANIGWYSIVAASAIGPAGRVYAFEPETENFNLAKHNIALNGFGNVTLEQLGIADRPGFLPVYLSPDNRGDHRLYGWEGAKRSDGVPTLTLGDYFADRPDPIRLVKSDAQGSEGMIFAGIPDDFAKARDIAGFIVEYWPAGLAAAGSSAEALLGRFAALELECFVIQEPFRGLDPIGLDVLRRRADGDLSPAKNMHANLLAIPKWKAPPDWLPPLVRSPDSPWFYRG